MTQRTLRAGPVMIAMALCAMALCWNTPDESSSPQAAAHGHEPQQPKALNRKAAASSAVLTQSSERQDAAIRGIIRSARGRNIERAQVCTAVSRIGSEWADCFESDQYGHFVIPALSDARWLIASAANHLPRVLELNAAAHGRDVIVVLEAGGEPVKGRVVDVTGGPVAGALVSGSAPDGALAMSSSDANGAFVLHLPKAENRLVATADGYSPGTRGVWSPATDVVLELTPASSIEGYVVQAGTEVPVDGVSVHAINTNGPRAAPRPAQTTPTGQFKLSGLPSGEYLVSATGPAWRSEALAVRVGVAEFISDIRIDVAPATTLTAKVLVGARPCDSGSVSVEGPAETASLTDFSGSAELRGLWPGQYVVHLYCPGSLPVTENLQIESAPLSRVWNLDPGLTLTGHVLEADGSPAAGALVRVDPLQSDVEAPSSHCKTDARGAFTCSGLLPGEYDAWVEQPLRSAVDQPQRIHLDARDTASVTLHLPATGTIRVELDRPDAADLHSLLVVARRRDQLTEVARLDDHGFVFENMLLGTYEVYIAPNAGMLRQVQLAAAGQVKTVQLPIGGKDSLSGIVLDERDVPVLDAWVQVSPADNALFMAAPSRQAMTNERGEFLLQDLVPGPYDLEITASAGRVQAKSVSTSDQTIVLRLEPAGDFF